VDHGGIRRLWQAFKDKGENWQATLGFGGNANAYTSNGPFGPRASRASRATTR
jgi:hypothetical protein